MMGIEHVSSAGVVCITTEPSLQSCLLNAYTDSFICHDNSNHSH